MRLVLDACVPIASTRPFEPSYAAATARVIVSTTRQEELVRPSFVPVEAARALARLGQAENGILALLDALTAPPHRIVPVRPKSACSARVLAIAVKLRGPDALYLWLAR